MSNEAHNVLFITKVVKFLSFKDRFWVDTQYLCILGCQPAFMHNSVLLGGVAYLNC